MDRNIIIVICCALFGSSALLAQSHDMLMNQGDRAYRAENYDEALKYYSESDLKRPEPTSAYNQANSLYHQEKIDEAITLWKRAGQSKDKKLQEAASHNLGNAYLQSQKLDEAIEAYKQALRMNPSAEDSRRNLAIAQQMQQEQQENSNENKEEDKENQDQEQQNENNEDQSSEDQEKQNQQQENQQASDQENKEGSAEQQLQKMTKQELMQLLKVLEEEDKKVQQKAAIRQSNGRKKDKQW